MAYKFITYGLVLLSTQLMGAACCGGGANLPNLIVGDYKAQFSFSASHSAVTHSVDSDGKFIKRNKSNQEFSETFNFMGAFQFSDFWQAGVTLPIKKNSYKDEQKVESSSGLGDVKLQLAYEFLPEYAYSWWQPRGFLFFQHSLANSKSTYDAEKKHTTDALGTGFQKTSFGFSFLKISGSFDFLTMSEFHHSWSRGISLGDGQELYISPGQGYSVVLGAGFSPKSGPTRYGVSFTKSHENKKRFSGEFESVTSEKDTYEIGVNLGHIRGENSYILGYADPLVLILFIF